jgi:hypothetical protein
MKTKNLIIGGSILSLFLVLGIIFYKKRKKESEENSQENSNEFEIKPPETLDKNDKNNVAYSKNGGATSYPPTPFKNEEEGNKFREWVIKKFPDKAKSLKLDPKGSFNNQTIRKAFFELGSIYLKELSDIELATKIEEERKKIQEEYINSTVPLNIVVPKKDNPEVQKKGFINIRTTPEVNNGTINNIAHKLKIGESVEYVKDFIDKNKVKWYQIKYLKPKTKTKEIGYIRSDVAEKKTIRVPKTQ